MEIDNRNKKPTQDPEMKAVIDSNEPIVEEVKIEEDPANQDPTPVVEIPVVEEPVVEIPEVAPTPEVDPTIVPVVVEEPEVDYKEKFKASTQEALALHFKNEKLQNTIEEAQNIPEPTEEEVRAYAESKGEDYEMLSDLTKAVIKDNLHNKKKFEKIDIANQESKDIVAWVGKVDHFIDSADTVNKYPDIIDNAEDFKAFAIKPSRRGMDLDDVATSFLYGKTLEQPKKNKGSILLPTGGVAEVKPEGITDDQAKAIRVNNPKEYKRLIKAGKIKIEI
jgi:hypothetical protein